MQNSSIVNTSSPAQGSIIKGNPLDTKFHQDIARFPLIFDQVYGEDAQLATQFTFWLCHKFERDIFGCFKVDLNQFASDMGYNTKSHFQEIIHDPYQFYKQGGREKMSNGEIQQLRASGEFIYETRFHNMVYKMANIVIRLKMPKEEAVNGTEEKQTTIFQTLIKRIDVFIDKKNRQKVYLLIQPSDYFVENLSRAYLLVSKDSFTMLAKSKKKRIENLYVYVSAWRSYALSKGLDSISMNFDRACEIIGVDHYQEQKHKKEKLKKYLQEIKDRATDLQFDFHFAPNGQWAYKPILLFKNITPLSTKERNEHRMDIFDSILTYCMTELFCELYPEHFLTDYKMYFNAWMKNKDADREKKKDAYCKAHSMCWNKKISRDHKKVDFFLDNLRHTFDQAELLAP